MKIAKITHPHAYELSQTRQDEALVTNQPMTERPYWYEHTETGQLYYDVCACVGWPSEVTDKDEGMLGYLGIIGVVKSKDDGKRPQDAVFQLLDERESKDVSSLLGQMLELRSEYGFTLHPDLLTSWCGDPERYVTTIALENEILSTRDAILITPPVDWYEPKAFDHYVRSLRSAVRPGHVRFYLGRGNEVMKTRMRDFRREDPAILAVGGLVHSLVSQTTWMDWARENMFTSEEI